VRGLVQRLDEAGYGCLVAFAPEAGARRVLLDGLIERGTEAVIFLGEVPTPQEVESLGTLRWIAMADDGEDDPRRIELGRAVGAELATRYLRELNHQRFAVLGPSSRGAARGVARVLEGEPLILPEPNATDDDPNAIKRAIRGLLDLPSPPTAIVCGSDAVALTSVRECILRGVRVPRDVSIVGFGDEPFARAALPSLTTVRHAAMAAGLQAAEAVLALLAGRSVEPYQPVVKLAIRESTGPAP
jgi:DNA-binding LacI/PurR family transcriptional regulator